MHVYQTFRVFFFSSGKEINVEGGGEGRNGNTLVY